MASPLTAGAIRDILTNPDDLPKNPVVQVLGLKKIQPTQGSGTERYRLVLSDGEHAHTCSDVETKFGDPKTFNESNAVQNGTKTNSNQNNSEKDYTSNANSTNMDKRNSSTLNQPVSRNKNGPNIYPISSLNPYQNRWTICARVTSKSNIRTWSNSRGDGRLFNVELIDESGEIRATCFTDFVDKFYEVLEPNKVYYISKGSLRPANKKYSSIKNDYELHFTQDTTVEPCTSGHQNLPTLQFNFVEIAKIESIEKDQLIDLIGVCSNIGDITEITIKSNNKQVSKREITLLDSTASVSCTLWGTDAENFEKHAGTNPVIAMKGARVSDFGGRSLSMLSSTTMQVNPDNLQEAFKLRGWYDSVGCSESITSISGQRGEGMGPFVYKNLNEVKVGGDLGSSDKPDYFNVVATVGYLKKDTCLYKACPKADCNKKVMEDGGHYRCEKCNQTYPDYKHRLILAANLLDATGEHWVTCFQESAETVLATSADDIGTMREQEDPKFEHVFSNSTFTTWNFKIRGKVETYNDEMRIKCTTVSVNPLDFIKESNRLLEEVQKS